LGVIASLSLVVGNTCAEEYEITSSEAVPLIYENNLASIYRLPPKGTLEKTSEGVASFISQQLAHKGLTDILAKVTSSLVSKMGSLFLTFITESQEVGILTRVDVVVLAGNELTNTIQTDRDFLPLIIVTAGTWFDSGVLLTCQRSIELFKWEIVRQIELLGFEELSALHQKRLLQYGDIFLVVPKEPFRLSTPGKHRLFAKAWCSSEGKSSYVLRVVGVSEEESESIYSAGPPHVMAIKSLDTQERIGGLARWSFDGKLLIGYCGASQWVLYDDEGNLKGTFSGGRVDSAGIADFTWTPWASDSSKLCFSTYSGISFLDRELNVLCEVPHHSLYSFSIRWSSGGNWVTFTEDCFVSLHESDIWMANSETGEKVCLTPDKHEGSVLRHDYGSFDWAPEWSREKNKITFVSATREIATVDIHSKKRGTLAMGDFKGTYLLRYSPDGNWLAMDYGNFTKSGPQVLLFVAEGKVRKRFVVPFISGITDIQWTNNSRYLLIEGKRITWGGLFYQYFIINIRSGECRIIDTLGEIGLSPTGESIIFAQKNTNRKARLYWMNLESGEKMPLPLDSETELFTEETTRTDVRWSPTGDKLFVGVGPPRLGYIIRL